MVKVCLKRLKVFLALGVRNLGSSKLWPLFVQLLDLANFLDVFDRPTVPPPPTTSLSSILEADAMDDPVIFNMAVSGAAILLKPLMKRK